MPVAGLVPQNGRGIPTGYGAGPIRAPAPRAGARYGLVFWFALALGVFNIALPKAGFALGTVPVTFGYIAVGLCAPIALIGLMQRPSLSPVPLLHFLLFYLPLTMLAIYRIESQGMSIQIALIYGVLFCVLPAAFLILFSSYLEDLTEHQIGQILRWTLAFVIVWGLMNFFLYAVTKKFIEIPYVTVNAADVGEIYDKNNRRGSLMKLVATYNNGNLLGACLVMLMPLYVYFTKSRYWIIAFCAAIILTLSRTAWFGLLCAFMSMVMLGQIRLNKPYIWLGGGMLGTLVVFMMPIIGWTPDKLVASDLGGRSEQLSTLTWSLFGDGPVRIYEIVYAGLLQSFGILGFMLAFSALAFPVVFGLFSLQRLSNLRKAALAGIISYLMVAVLDGAFLFPPVFLQFILLAALLYRRGYRGSQPPSAGLR